MVAFAIREARAGEEDQVLAMYEWLFAPPGSRPRQWDRDRARLRLSEAVASPRGAILVAEDRGVLIAFCTAYLDLNSVRFGERCWVEDFAVDPHLELDSGLARAGAHRFYEREGGTRQSYTFGWEL